MKRFIKQMAANQNIANVDKGAKAKTVAGKTAKVQATSEEHTK